MIRVPGLQMLPPTLTSLSGPTSGNSHSTTVLAAMSVCLTVSVCLSVCRCACLIVCPADGLYVCLSASGCVYLSLYSWVRRKGGGGCIPRFVPVQSCVPHPSAWHFSRLLCLLENAVLFPQSRWQNIHAALHSLHHFSSQVFPGRQVEELGAAASLCGCVGGLCCPGALLHHPHHSCPRPDQCETFPTSLTATASTKFS